MRRRLKILAFISILSFSTLPGIVSPQSLITNEDVVDLIKAGISAEIVVAKIRSSNCKFDTSAVQLKALKAAGVSDDVILAMIKAPSSKDIEIPDAEIAQLSEEVIAERDVRDSLCPQCKFVLISNVNSQTGEVTDDWASNAQREWFKDYLKKVGKGKKQLSLLPTKYRQNADYIIFWTSAQGFRPYVIYVPQTEISTANISGVYSTYGTDWPTFGNLGGIINVRRTYYTARTYQRSYVDVNLVVYDRSGKKVFETWHQGNWVWSKPDEDCLEDAFNYLANLPTVYRPTHDRKLKVADSGEIEESTIPTNIDRPRLAPGVLYETRIFTSFPLTAKPNPFSEQLLMIQTSDTIEILERGSVSYKARVNGITGYVPKSYLIKE